MEVKQIWANLGVKDLNHTTKFYESLGFRKNGVHNAELTSFSVGNNNFVINFFLKIPLEGALKGQLADALEGNEVLFSLSPNSRDEIDEWAKKVESAGGALISRPEKFGYNYYGFVFADPDGHRFNFFWMEGM
ncbi:VOC family protein [Flavobacterium sp. RHBU_24]|uniref:VOC family protein n=1 Tax=Flavobacterium sp. RHBU_24 TaxID=3391185 RepID=UPI00398493E5